MLSLLLSEVPIEPVAERLWPTLQVMAEQVLERLVEAVADGTVDIRETTYFDWLSAWCRQFQHWHDPIRMLMAEYCKGDDAATVAQHFQRFNGLAFADFVIAAICAHDERCLWQARIMEQTLPAPSLPLTVPRPTGASAMDWACQQLYSDLQERARFATRPARPSYNLRTLVKDIYAGEDDHISPTQIVLWEDKL
ncbi:hypothetical protein Y88_3865 [Novosphingobium nitrogenifigens DSM 19370]|uniref:Uncharacterized protein n=1 Tax=Novosphingobium nitrogenifigens DSM 19370 TaxID=983920 RepID=F1ZCW0_9SPHN|nr:hypothetical protein [Novosphingobium nitrogenifigens]EGD57553.1 hypothetical protein Y88_3865 [Novosphingobium nitrogenifigens DSM 19370]